MSWYADKGQLAEVDAAHSVDVVTEQILDGLDLAT